MTVTGLGDQAWRRIHGNTGRFGTVRDAAGDWHVIDHATDAVGQPCVNHVAALRLAYDQEVEWLATARRERIAT